MESGGEKYTPLSGKAKVIQFSRFRMKKLMQIVENYFLVKDDQGYQAAVDYFNRVTPKQLKDAVAKLINERVKK